jgi:hypothetical protein
MAVSKAKLVLHRGCPQRLIRSSWGATVRATTERGEEKLKKNQTVNESDPKKMNQEKLVPRCEFHTVSF